MTKKLKNIELRSEEIEEILTKIPNGIILYGNILLLSLILLILTISWFIKYPDIIKSQAIITTSRPVQKEYSKVTAKIDTILVEDKQTVLPNQLLAILQNSAHFKDVLHLKSLLDTINIETDYDQFIMTRSQDWILGEVESSFAVFETNYIKLQLYNDLKPFSNKQLSDKNTVFEIKNQLEDLQAQREIQQAELTLKKNKLNRSNLLFEKGIISTAQYEQDQIEYITAEREFKNVNITESRIKTLLTNAMNLSRTTDIDKAKEEINLHHETLQSLHALKKSIKDWEMNYVLKSEINGSISFLEIWAEHQHVNKGDLLFTLIPIDNSEYIARLKTPIRNSGKIKIGQKVIITLSNYPDTEYGRLIGKVQDISSMPNENGLFIVNVLLSKRLITTYNKELVFKQEMSGDAEIITKDLRLLEIIFYKFKDVLSR